MRSEPAEKIEETVARRPAPPTQPPRTGAAHVIDLVRETVPPLHPAGVPFVAGPLALALLGRNHRLLRRTSLIAAGACATFFRHPARVPSTRYGAVVAPADGLISLVDRAVPPAELTLGTEPVPRVSIFLSVLDVHVQRAPVAGEVVSINHRAGKFLSADLAEASEVNERNSVHLRTPSGHDIGVVQIAGLIARRIVCNTSVGQSLALGETYGLIRFGSRVDTYFPAGTELLVERGQRAVGAETVLAELV